MINKNSCLMFSFLFLSLSFAGYANATDRYMATTGVNVGDCSNEPTPCMTLQYAMSQMNGGDVLYIEDGNYTSSSHYISKFNYPPSGTPVAFTVIRAKNIPCQGAIPCNQPLLVKFSGNAKFNVTNYPDNDSNKKVQYLKFWGIRWDGISTFTGWDNIYFKQVASQGVVDGNTTSITINGQKNLLEDVVTFGKGRYKILFYNVSRGAQINGDGNNLCRRCLVRQDWAIKDDAVSGPIAGISSYFNRGTALLNSIVIDSDTPSEWQDNPTELSSAFYQPVDGGPHAFVIKGSMAINTAMAVLFNRSGSTGHIVNDFLALKTAGGIYARGQTDIDKVTFIDLGTNNFTYRSPLQKSKVISPDDGIKLFGGDGPVTLQSSIFRDLADDGVDGTSVTSDYINMYLVTDQTYINSPMAPNFYTDDPFSNGLKYPIRIEPGSILSSRGSSGGQIGANIMNKLGVDGTFKGDTDWDTEQGPLWPWPLEEWVKAEMKTSEYTTDATRGFAADNETLTNYIWGYLGNT